MSGIASRPHFTSRGNAPVESPQHLSFLAAHLLACPCPCLHSVPPTRTADANDTEKWAQRRHITKAYQIGQTFQAVFGPGSVPSRCVFVDGVRPKGDGGGGLPMSLEDRSVATPI